MWVDNAFPFDTYSLQCIHLLQSANGLFIQSKRLTNGDTIDHELDDYPWQ